MPVLLVAVVMEVGTAYVIRDGLLLNILTLIYPIEAIKHWQSGLT